MNMFCHKCGKKLEAGDEFCQSCGAKVSIDDHTKNSSVGKSTKRTDLEKKAWYRALKVIYIILIVAAVLIIGVVSWSTKPVKTMDSYNSSISCNNGKSYSAGKNNIYLYSWENVLDSSDDKDARILCEYDTLNFYSHSSEFIAKNYTFIPVYEDMKYGSWIGYTILAYFILWLLAYIIKISFFYIAIGEKPRLG